MPGEDGNWPAAPASIRRLSRDEMDGVALVHRASFDERMPWLAGLHTPSEDRAYVRTQVFARCKV